MKPAPEFYARYGVHLTQIFWGGHQNLINSSALFVSLQFYIPFNSQGCIGTGPFVICGSLT